MLVLGISNACAAISACTLQASKPMVFGVTLKNLILIGISSNFLHNVRACKNVIKMENSLSLMNNSFDVNDMNEVSKCYERKPCNEKPQIFIHLL